MTRFIFLGVAAILSTATATPIFAQAAIQEPGAYAFYHPNGDLGIGSAPGQRRDVVGRETADALAFAPPRRSVAAGQETTTTPLSAPAGHLQPPVATVPTPTSPSHHTPPPQN